jgi:hypothetical protein
MAHLTSVLATNVVDPDPIGADSFSMIRIRKKPFRIPEKSDPDPKEIIPDPQHCMLRTTGGVWKLEQTSSDLLSLNERRLHKFQ